MDLPKFPFSSIIREGTIGDCPVCHSTTEKRFGKSIGCINSECSNYKNNKQYTRLKKLRKLNRWRIFDIFK